MSETTVRTLPAGSITASRSRAERRSLLEESRFEERILLEPPPVVVSVVLGRLNADSIPNLECVVGLVDRCEQPGPLVQFDDRTDCSGRTEQSFQRAFDRRGRRRTRI
ncbi:hypothetical protein CP556_23090 [Natrinema sp. CBA1119]|nr:hypothetical protein CP556_23090 [Natrinema sp. CBA1119]